MRITRQNIAVAAASLFMLGTLGCTALSEKQSDPFHKPAKKQSSFLERIPWVGKKKGDTPEPYPNPVKIAATWTPDTLLQTGRTPTRGFGGRVFFYDEKSRPVPVAGTLIVHGFNDAAEKPEDRVKRFEFTPEQFTRHYSQTDLGASYSVWIPWDAIGGDRSRISLVTSFQPAEGQLIQGVPASLMLPGKAPEETEGEMTADLPPLYRKHLAATAAGSTRKSGLTTTTIARRRGATSHGKAGPGLMIPTTKQQRTSIAASQATPSLDLEMPRAMRSSPVRPASAQMPIER